jgi:hypothetical protein
MSEETTAAPEKQPKSVGSEGGAWATARRRLGQGFVGLLALAAAAGGGYMEGEKIGAAKAVAREVFTREHRELKDLEGGIQTVRERLRKIHDQERAALKTITDTNATQQQGPAGNGNPPPTSTASPVAPAGPASSVGGER